MKNTIKNIKRTWPYIKKYKGSFIIYIIINIIMIGVSLALPILSARIIIDLTSNKLKQVVYMAIIILFIRLVMYILRYFSDAITEKIYRECFKKMQVELGSEILKMENETLDNNSSGTFIQRITEDTRTISDIYFILYESLTNIITNIGIFIAIFIINKYVFLYILISIIILYILDKKRVKMRNIDDKKYRGKREQMYSFIEELVRGARDIKMLNAEKSFVKEMQHNINDVNNQRYEMQIKNRNYFI